MRHYYQTTSSTINTLLTDAEERKSYLFAATDSLHRALKTRTDHGHLVMPFPKVYVRKDYWTSLNETQRMSHLLRAVHDAHPTWAFCGISAAILLGLQVPYAILDGTVHIATDRHHKSLRTHRVKRHAMEDVEFTDINGIRTTSLLRTTIDCMRSLSFAHGTAIADSALHTGNASHEDLMFLVNTAHRGLRGIAQARKTAWFADARSANGGESVARATMHELGFATPDLQVAFPDPLEPGLIYYADYAWNHERHALARETRKSRSVDELIIGELDGVEKYFDMHMTKGEGPRSALLRERKRESRLTIHHGSVVRFSYKDVLDTARFNLLLDTYGVPRDHEPLITVPKLVIPYAAGDDYLPPEALDAPPAHSV